MPASFAQVPPSKLGVGRVGRPGGPQTTPSSGAVGFGKGVCVLAVHEERGAGVPPQSYLAAMLSQKGCRSRCLSWSGGRPTKDISGPRSEGVQGWSVRHHISPTVAPTLPVARRP